MQMANLERAFGATLREIRLDKKMSQEVLAFGGRVVPQLHQSTGVGREIPQLALPLQIV